LRRDTPGLRDACADDVGREGLGPPLFQGCPEDPAEGFACEVDVDLAARQRRICQQLDDGTLELADGRSAVAGDEVQHLFHAGDLESVLLGPLPEDGDARLEVRELDVGDESPLEARDETVLDTY